MKARTVQEFDVDSVSIDIKYSFNADKWVMRVNWTCPKCAGHGCGRHGGRERCNNGAVLHSLEELVKYLDHDDAHKFFEKFRMLQMLRH